MTVLRGRLAPAKGRTIIAASVILMSGLAVTFAARMLSERIIAADMQRRFSDERLQVIRKSEALDGIAAAIETASSRA